VHLWLQYAARFPASKYSGWGILEFVQFVEGTFSEWYFYIFIFLLLFLLLLLLLFFNNFFKKGA
jgi:uncharacterized protein (DUF58 family)